MTNVELECRFFKEGYEHKSYLAVMDCLAKGYVDHSPARGRGSAEP